MITIVSGSNRRKNLCQLFAIQYKELIEAAGGSAQILNMDEVPSCILHPDMYEKDGQDPRITALQDQFITQADKFVFIVPEYNGSIPGIVKLFIDAISIRNYKSNFKNKMSALVGIASGRAGNLRGLEHLTGILMHMGGLVLPNRLPISKVETLMNEAHEIVDEGTIGAMTRQVEELVKY